MGLLNYRKDKAKEGFIKRGIIVFMVVAMLVVFPLLAFGKSSKSFDSYLHKGNLAVMAGIGLGYYGSITVCLSRS